jgi:hypothetical protein
MNNSTPFYFVGDRQLYYDAHRGGPLMAAGAAIKRLMSSGRCSTEAEAMQLLAQISLAPVTEGQLAALKSSRTQRPQLDWDIVYTEIQSLFPLYSRVTARGERQIYFADEKNQVSLIHYEDDDSLVNSLMHNKVLWRKFKEYYRTSATLEPFRAQLNLRTFMVTIIKNHLLMDETKLIEQQPKNFSWSTDDLAFKKFDPSLLSDGPTPTWDEFCSRLNYPDVFKAWVWSLFTPDNNIRQAMWLTGSGNDGKSAVQKALRDIFGAQHVYDCKKGDESRQWFQSNVYGKCLVNYADCDNPHLLSIQAIKQLTGGDATSIEEKGVSAFSAEIYAKLFVSSNMPPKINPDFEAQTSRLIRLKLRPIASGEPKDEQFKTRLITEAYAFLAECRQHYEKHINAGNDALILPAELTKEIETECAEEDYYIVQEFVKKYVEFGPQYFCRPGKLNEKVKEFVVFEQHYNSDKPRFVQSKLEAKLGLQGIRMQGLNIKDEEFAAYVGFRLKDQKDGILEAP